MGEVFGALPGIGCLTMGDVYVWHDQPLSFLCVNKAKQKFLTLAVGTWEDDEWLLISVSDIRLAQMLNNEISFYSVFAEPEDNYVWRIRSQSEDTLLGEVHPPSEIPQKDLPVPGSLLELTEEDRLQFLKNLAVSPKNDKTAELNDDGNLFLVDIEKLKQMVAKTLLEKYQPSVVSQIIRMSDSELNAVKI